jgi:hypothetical protein
MKTHTTSITLTTPAERAFAYIADGENLPHWAIGFARAIERNGDGWIVTLASGARMPLRIDADTATGVVDFVSLPAPDVEVPAHTRVVPCPGGAIYTFAMQQGPGTPDDVFEAQVEELGRELTVLKARLETACPL